MSAMRKTLALLLSIASFSAFSQTVFCQSDTIVYYLPSGARGAVQWQESANGVLFNNIAGATGDSLLVIANSTATYRAQLIEGTCAPVFTTPELATVNAAPSPAVAGADQNVTGATTTNLNATAPMVGTGTWTILSGVGGSVLNPGNPVSAFSGVAGSSYILLWEVSNAPCASNFDTVEVTFVGSSSLPSVLCNSVTLYVHPADQSGPMSWGCSGIVAGAGDDNNGVLNTATIVAACPAPTATHVCDNLVDLGYSDWYLPSYNELECIRQNAAAIGGFAAGAYWSSTEGTGIFTANARYRTFPSGVSGYGSKSNQNRVRCVRQ